MDENNEQKLTRQSLLSRLRDWNDSASWQMFFDRYWRLIYSTGLRAGLRHADAEDLVQETMISVAKSMPGFKYSGERGSFRSWLLLVTYRRISDHLGKWRPDGEILGLEPSAPTETSVRQQLIDAAPSDLEAIWNEEWETHILRAAISIVKKKVNPKAYQLYDLHVLKGRPVAEVARAMKVSHARVYLAKHRVGTSIKKTLMLLRNKPI